MGEVGFGHSRQLSLGVVRPWPEAQPEVDVEPAPDDVAPVLDGSAGMNQTARVVAHCWGITTRTACLATRHVVSTVGGFSAGACRSSSRKMNAVRLVQNIQSRTFGLNTF